MQGKITFRFGITQAFVIFTLLFSVAIAFNIYERVSEMILDLSDQLTSVTNEKIIEQSRRFLSRPEAFTQTLAKSVERNGGADNIVENHQRLWLQMWEPILITPQLQSYFVANNEGSYVQVRREPQYATRIINRSIDSETLIDRRIYRDSEYNMLSETRKPTVFDPRKRPWYINSPANNTDVYWSDIYISTSAQTPVVGISKSFWNNSGEKIGVLSANLPLYQVSDKLKKVGDNENVFLLIYDENKQVVAHPDKSRILQIAENGSPRLRTVDELKNPLFKQALQSLNQAQPKQSFFVHEGSRYDTFKWKVDLNSSHHNWQLLAITKNGSGFNVDQLNHLNNELSLFFSQPEEKIKQIAKRYQGVSHLDVSSDTQNIWLQLWQPLISSPQLQSLFIADQYGSHIQVRREPYLATRIIDRSVSPNQKQQYIDRKIYRDIDFSLISEKQKLTRFDPRVRPWYQDTSNESKVRWADVYISTSAQTPVIAATYPILNAYGKKEGVVGVNVPLYSLSEFVAARKVSENGIAFIVDGQDRLIAYPDKSELLYKKENGKFDLKPMNLISEPYIQEIYNYHALHSEKKRFSLIYADKTYLVTIKSFAGIFDHDDWKLFTVIPESDLLSGIYKMLFDGGVIILCLMIVSVVIIIVIANRISRPIMQLTKSTEALETFDLKKVEGVESRFVEIHKMSNALLQARRGLESFEKYVPADLVRHLIKTQQSAKIGGDATEVTLFFSDIAGFTSISEQLSPQELMLHLSDYLNELSTLIIDEQGTIDKYIGDAIMAFWGAPIPQDDAALRCCRAALSCRERLEELNHIWAEAGKPTMQTRFGIHTGEVIVGNLGSSQRMNYSVIGDSVNLASRLEGVNKEYGTKIIISDITYERVKHQFDCRALDTVTVKGKTKGVLIYELLGERSTKKSQLIS